MADSQPLSGTPEGAEYLRAVLRFLNTLGTHWNISLFHYRSHGTDYGRVLAAFELGDHEPDFETRLNELGYDCHDETHNPAFRFFLAG